MMTVPYFHSESHDKHNAATRISLLYRYCKARRIVFQKRTQKHLELCIHNESRLTRAVILAQTAVRMFLVRVWFYKRGIKFKVFSAKKKQKLRKPDKSSAKIAKSKLIPKADIRGKVLHDVNIRAVNNRNLVMQQLAESYAHIVQVGDPDFAGMTD